MAREGLFDDSGYMGFEECPRYVECCDEAYERGRADAIEEFVEFANTMPTVEEDGEIRPMRLEEMAEQLKSQDT